MTELQTSPDDLASDPRRDPSAPRGASDGGGHLGIVAVLVAAAGLYITLALRCPIPQIVPDEYLYSHTARSLAEGHGLTWHGQQIGKSAALYVFAIAPAWRFFTSTTSAYDASKVIGTLALCTTAVPVYALARELIGNRRAALLPAVLSVAGTWMLAGAMTVTEVIAYPLTTAALCATVIALRRRSGGLGLLALGFAVLAAGARLQLVVIVFVVFGAFVADVLLAAGHRRELLRAHRTVLVAGGALSLLLAAGALTVHSLAGDYSEVYGFHPSLATLARKAGLQGLELVISSGFVPVLLAVAASVSMRAWRDDRVRPLLIVFWLATVALVGQSGWYLASISDSIPTGIERYESYAVPLAVVLLVLLAREPWLLPRGACVLAAVLSLAFFLMPGRALVGIEPATWATGRRVGQLASLDHAPALVLAALLAVGAAALAIRRRHALLAVFAVVIVVLGVQSETGWKRSTDDTRQHRRLFAEDLQWFDHHTDGPAALLRVAGETDQLNGIELFNRNIIATLQPANDDGSVPPVGQVCGYQVAVSGELTVGCGEGTGQPHQFVVTDPYAAVTMYHELSRARDPRMGQAIRVTPDQPARVRSFVIAPCARGLGPWSEVAARNSARQPCRRDYTVALWLDAPGSVALRFQGGTRPRTLRAGSRAWTLPAGRTMTLHFPVPGGSSVIRLGVDWRAPGGAPRLLSAALRQGTTTSSLL